MKRFNMVSNDALGNSAVGAARRYYAGICCMVAYLFIAYLSTPGNKTAGAMYTTVSNCLIIAIFSSTV